MKIKKGDVVKVISGNAKFRGTVQKVVAVDREGGRVYLENGPIKKRHMKPERSRKHPEGGIIEKPGSIHVSNLMLMCEASNSPVRVGFKEINGKKVRVAKGRRASGEIV
jgi:large subunit ribosomal protein L24